MTVLLGLGQSTPPIITSPINTGNFPLEQYLKDCGVHSCQDGSIFHHVSFIESTVFEVICPVGSVVFVNARENGIRPSTIKSCVGDSLYIEYLGTDIIDREWITISDLVTDIKQLEYAISEHPGFTTMLPNLVNIEAMNEYKTRLDYQIFELIKTGQFFELQDEFNPKFVYICEVIRTYGGVIVFRSACLGKNKIMNITSSRCHAVGWVSKQLQEVFYFPYCDEQLLELAFSNPVPSLVFESSTVKVHKFKENMLLQVRDPLTNELHIGHVSRVINNHYFEVTSGVSNEILPCKVVCEKGSWNIFPFGYSHREPAPIRTPAFLACGSKYVTYGSDQHALVCQMYTEYFQMKAMVLASIALFDIPQCQGKIACFRYLELFCYEQGLMTPALIVNVTKDCLHLLPEHQKDPTRIVKVAYNSPLIFPAGFHQLYGLPLVSSTSSCSKMIDLQSCRSAMVSRAVTSRMVPTPQPIFRKRNKKATLRFVPDIYLRAKVMIPEIRVNKQCLLGRWFQFSRFRALPSYYSGGPLPTVIENIVKDLFRCVLDDQREKFVGLLHTTEDIPVVVVKHKWRTEHILMRVSVCETAEQFPNWLRCFLRFLGCCPNLINMNDFISECYLSCNCLAQGDAFVKLKRNYLFDVMQIVDS